MRSAEEYLEEIDRLRAENDRLQGIVTSYAMTEREQKSKNDKLRAALAHVREWIGFDSELAKEITALTNEETK